MFSGNFGVLCFLETPVLRFALLPYYWRIHERNIQVLLTEIFKAKSRIAPEIMTQVFNFNNHSYDLRKNNYIERWIIKSCKYGSETVLNLGAKLLDILPENIKKAESLEGFKNKIKFWALLNCPCKLSKT